MFFDGGECTEQKAIDVGQYGGTAWGDAALLEGEGKIPQESVDVGGGFFFGKVGEEQGGEVGGVVALAFPGKTGVTDAEGGMAGGELGAALAAFGGVVLTARM